MVWVSIGLRQGEQVGEFSQLGCKLAISRFISYYSYVFGSTDKY